MFLTSAAFRNFRNIGPIDLRFDQKFNLFIGDNGQGKSNLLEGLSLLLRGQSFRSAGSVDFVNFDEDSAMVKGLLKKQELVHSVQIRFENLKKKVLLNQKNISSAALKKKFSCILFSPDSLNAIKFGPQLRRSLVDDLVASSDPRMIETQRKFAQILRSRNRILKDVQSNKTTRVTALDMLKSLDQLFIGISVDLSLQRVNCLSSIHEPMVYAMKQLFDENVDISVEYVVSDALANNWSRENFINAHRQRRIELLDSELSTGMTLVGPHKHDVLFKMNGRDSRYYCSQGQQRALILAFKMAQILYHRQIQNESMILLLDDVLSELDFVRQTRLLEFLWGLDSQIFLTTTDARIPEGIAGQCSVRRISEGRLDEFGVQECRSKM